MNPNQIQILYRMMEGQAIQQYRLEHLLGAGGFGGVFKASEVARDRVLRQLAIKLISNTSDDQLVELHNAVNLDHPHVIRCFTAGECKLFNADFLFLVMELAAGSLDQQLGQGAMPESSARKLIQDVATALRFLHQQNKVHCDLKPGNILFAQDRWKLADLGLIRQLGASSYELTSNPIGTIAFMPPEAFDDSDRKKRISTAWDMWSLGIMTAGVMTGKLPYNYNDQTQLLKQVINAQVQIPQLPEPFNAIVRGCLNTNYRQRWTADQVLDVLTPKRSISTPQSPPRVSAVTVENRSIPLPNNGGSLEFIAVPGGTLVMEGGHQVNLKPFLMGKYPITQRQYQAIMGNNPSYFTGDLDRPVETVTWHDAIDFCKKLSKAVGQTIDLPSETMWEWAARGATRSKGYTYAGSNNLDEVGWYGKNSGSKTHPVGQKKPNELGIYDMSGNVWEWCKDNWADNANVLSGNGSALTSGGNSDWRAVRGGSWSDYPVNCRCAQRSWYGPGNRDYFRGFRVCVAASAL
jgi:formylglycine-generating enzyme required for sulfatase activity